MEQINELPELPGVYFFYDQSDKLIYIGKSIHIKSRVKQHFSGKDRKSLKIQHATKRIAYEVMGSELIALLYESDLIKKHQPLYNRSQRRIVYQYGLYLEEQHGYKSLRIARITTDGNEVTCFSSMMEAKTTLYRITEQYGLCQKINGLYKTTNTCFQYYIKSCNGACIGKEPAELYNARVDDFLSKTVIDKFTHLFEVPGRSAHEKGLVYIENGVYKGFGFCSIEQQVTGDYLNFITPYPDNRDVRRIVMRYLIQHGTFSLAPSGKPADQPATSCGEIGV